MIFKRIHNLESFQEKEIKSIFTDALKKSYKIRLNKYEDGLKVFTDLSFTEIIEQVLSDKISRHITIYYRDRVFNNDFIRWEFAMSSDNYFIELSVRDDLAMEIIQKYKLQILKD